MGVVTGLLSAIPLEWVLAVAAAVGAMFYGWGQRRAGRKEGGSLERAKATEQDAAAAAEVRRKARAVDDVARDGDAADWLRDRFSAPGGRSKPEG